MVHVECFQLVLIIYYVFLNVMVKGYSRIDLLYSMRSILICSDGACRVSDLVVGLGRRNFDYHEFLSSLVSFLSVIWLSCCLFTFSFILLGIMLVPKPRITKLGLLGTSLVFVIMLLQLTEPWA
ncbi:hypothetical protein PVK06_016542 [Gossypium arboreum]|uniref:Uncharacterized protein n=1 Tax=Gossypium arboreum TaxID=29729 RepID=A0ABR0Q0R0_GOSAR|nr:hypothetical protein PVK06_016542 [Gossypium arboreum]